MPTEQSDVLMGAFIPELVFNRNMKYDSGKIRENYSDEHERIMITTDRISAFDVVMRQGIPFKGQNLDGISHYWKNETKGIVSNDIMNILDSNVCIVEQCTALPVEVIMRGYLAGSCAKDYAAGSRVKSGIPLPEGMKRNQKFEQPILTPTTKETKRDKHDEDISREEILAKGMVTPDVWKQIEEVALRLYERGVQLSVQRGLILVDTKYEFGLAADGSLRLIDEVHTPDSSRYWIASDYDAWISSDYTEAKASGKDDPKQLSKEFLREHLKNKLGFEGQTNTAPDLPAVIVREVATRYVDLYKRVTGQEFIRSAIPIRQRVITALRDAGYIKGKFVPIIAGSEKDASHYNKITERLEAHFCPYKVFNYSAHKQARQLLPLLEQLETSIEPIAFITVAGMSNALGGFVAGNMKDRRPVINCPPFADLQAYQIDIHSSMRMPSDVPVATIVNPKNAADFAVIALEEAERLL
jgi:phosphoribosylaminoimidazole-succinocarboxamide synthase